MLLGLRDRSDELGAAARLDDLLGRLIDLARAFGGSGAMIASASCRLRGVDYV